MAHKTLSRGNLSAPTSIASRRSAVSSGNTAVAASSWVADALDARRMQWMAKTKDRAPQRARRTVRISDRQRTHRYASDFHPVKTLPFDVIEPFVRARRLDSTIPMPRTCPGRLSQRCDRSNSRRMISVRGTMGQQFSMGRGLECRCRPRHVVSRRSTSHSGHRFRGIVCRRYENRPTASCISSVGQRETCGRSAKEFGTTCVGISTTANRNPPRIGHSYYKKYRYKIKDILIDFFRTIGMRIGDRNERPMGGLRLHHRTSAIYDTSGDHPGALLPGEKLRIEALRASSMSAHPLRER